MQVLDFPNWNANSLQHFLSAGVDSSRSMYAHIRNSILAALNLNAYLNVRYGSMMVDLNCQLGRI